MLPYAERRSGRRDEKEHPPPFAATDAAEDDPGGRDGGRQPDCAQKREQARTVVEREPGSMPNQVGNVLERRKRIDLAVRRAGDEVAGPDTARQRLRAGLERPGVAAPLRSHEPDDGSAEERQANDGLRQRSGA